MSSECREDTFGANQRRQEETEGKEVKEVKSLHKAGEHQEKKPPAERLHKTAASTACGMSVIYRMAETNARPAIISQDK